MASFLKVLFRNVLEGPSTDPFPLGETFTPERLRAKCVVDPELCMGCGVCKSVCAADAIDITPKPDKSGHTITIWRNACCLCASCRHYCPTGAMSITNDWHFAHAQEDKYNAIEQETINYEPCAQCGVMIRPLPLKIAQKLYAENDQVDAEEIRHLCPQCRQLKFARRMEGKKDSTLPEDSSAAERQEAASQPEAAQTQKAETA